MFTCVTISSFSLFLPFLRRLFELTGRVKVPVVVSQIKAWLNENDGKIIIFAHHRTVLDKIEEAISTVKRIRIDGATNPRKRQGYVQAFQNDPSVRVAVLSTTAAGVALTLTASSVVWFAEMFWTPGLLIQAEDRAHRIGQKNDVRVKYFVAKDTLDDGRFFTFNDLLVLIFLTPDYNKDNMCCSLLLPKYLSLSIYTSSMAPCSPQIHCCWRDGGRMLRHY